MSMHNGRGPLNTNQKLDKEVLKRLLVYILKNNKIGLVLVFISLIISSVIGVITSLFTKFLIDDYIDPLLTMDNPVYDALKNAIIIYILVSTLGSIMDYLFQEILIYVTQGTLKKARNDLFKHMETLPIRYFDSNSRGDVMSIYTNDIDTLRQLISQSIPSFLSGVITIISVFISMLILSFQLTLVTVFVVFIMQYAIKKIAGLSGKYFMKQQSQIGKTSGYVEEFIQGIRVVKVFNFEDRAIKEFEKINDELFNNSFKANKYSSIIMPVMANLGNLAYVLEAIIGGYLAIKINSITVGTLASFLTLNRSFTMPLTRLSQQFNSIILGMAGADRIFKLMDEESEINKGKISLVNLVDDSQELCECKEETKKWAWKKINDDNSITYIPLKGDVRFNNVSFSYVENEPVLKNINLYAYPGQKIAFVGATGAGKTTITNLLNRFYEIQEGTITYDGIDIKDIDKRYLRKSLGIVLQDTNLFSGTIKDNIKYANINASDEEVLEAAKIANADHFITQLEKGYDTVLKSDGSPLSQGQKQLINIARVALANAPVLILDEATSSIDSRTEKHVQSGMDGLMQGRTTFVIAHRLSTIKNSDVIMVLDHGEIIERGDHDTLLEQKGVYYKLYTGKSE